MKFRSIHFQPQIAAAITTTTDTSDRKGKPFDALLFRRFAVRLVVIAITSSRIWSITRLTGTKWGTESQAAPE